MTHHLGYEPHAVEGRKGGNSRNGSGEKTLVTEHGERSSKRRRFRRTSGGKRFGAATARVAPSYAPLVPAPPRNPSAPRGSALTFPTKLFTTVAPLAGLTPYTLCTWVWPPGLWNGHHPPQDSFLRSFRIDDRGCWAHLTLFGRDSVWRRATTDNLLAAGYEIWLSDSAQVDLRRWLRNRRERLSELAFLRALGNGANPRRWPKRRASSPSPTQRHAWPFWWGVLHDLTRAGIRWIDAAAGVSRRATFASPAGLPPCTINVAACSVTRGRIFVSAGVSTREPEGVPKHVVRSVKAALAEVGFVPHRLQSKLGRSHIAYEAILRSPEKAVDLCVDAFGALEAAATMPIPLRLRTRRARHDPP